MSWRPSFNRTWCPNDANTEAPDLQKTESVIVNETGKVEVHITDNKPWNSHCKVAFDLNLLSVSLAKKKKKKVL